MDLGIMLKLVQILSPKLFMQKILHRYSQAPQEEVDVREAMSGMLLDGMDPSSRDPQITQQAAQTSGKILESIRAGKFIGAVVIYFEEDMDEKGSPGIRNHCMIACPSEAMVASDHVLFKNIRKAAIKVDSMGPDPADCNVRL